jgi:phage shock protein A
MGIFTRFKDIVNSNLNAMLDRAEDPEKLIKLMIREMEDTLVELKASCAGIIADRKKMERRLNDLHHRENQWNERADLAVEKGRDDLAREALIEKRRFTRLFETLEKDLMENNGLIGQYQDDIRQLEEKLGQAREKQRMLVQRHVRASQAKRAQEEIRRVDNHETISKFDDLENRIERMEADADLVNFGRKKTLEDKFEELASDDDIEKELADIKASKNKAVTSPETE